MPQTFNNFLQQNSSNCGLHSWSLKSSWVGSVGQLRITKSVISHLLYISQLGGISGRVQSERKNRMGYWIYCRNYTLYQRSKKICKKPESTFFLLCGPNGLCHSSSILLHSTEQPLTMQKQIGTVVFQQNLILKKKTDSERWVIWSSLLYTRVGLAGDMTSQRGVWKATGESLNSHRSALVQRTFRSWR